MKVQPSTVGWLVVTGALAAALVASHWPRSEAGEKVPASIAKTADSLKVTRPAADNRRDSLVRSAAADTMRAVRAERLAKAARDSAERFRKAADSAAALARVYGDSAFLWRDAYENRTAEAGQLRTALDSAEAGNRAMTSAAASLRLAWLDADARRRQAEEVVIPGLERAIRQLDQPCRIVGPIKCPSRRVSFVAGAVGAVVILSAAK